MYVVCMYKMQEYAAGEFINLWLYTFDAYDPFAINEQGYRKCWYSLHLDKV